MPPFDYGSGYQPVKKLARLYHRVKFFFRFSERLIKLSLLNEYDFAMSQQKKSTSVFVISFKFSFFRMEQAQIWNRGTKLDAYTLTADLTPHFLYHLLQN